MTSMGIRNIRLVVRIAIPAFLMLAAVVALTYALPALAQESDPDGARDGAVSLGAQSPDKGRQFFYDKSLDRANGDGVDYYTFTTDDHYTLGLGARDQTIELKVALEDANGNVVGTAGPPTDPNKDQVYIEWLQITIDAGTYYVLVEALEDGQTSYYLRFGLEHAPNRAPEFGSATYSFSIAEDAASGGAVGTAAATDADDDTLTYTIESGNGDGKFAIDGGTGAITTAGALDHETTPSYTLTVQADDGEGGTATATVSVTVTDVDESTTGPLAGFTLVDASDQTVLATLTDGASVELADADGGSYGIRADLEAGESAGSVRLELSGAKTVSRTESSAPYSLYGDGGANALRGGSLPAGSYTLTATAYSESGRAGDQLGTLEVSFTVTQANRAPEFGSATYSFSIAEDAATGDAVGSVSATDADDDTLTYTIESGNGDGKFAIDGGTGAIITAGALDHETTPSYTLTVQADDGEGGTATATVSVTVTDVDESTTGPLAGFTLVDASDQTVLATLTDGASVELADADGGSYGIRADMEAGETAGSVRLELSGAKTVSRTESVAPYSLYGDGGEDALNGEALPAGSYTLTATAYAESGRAGDQLGTLEVSFTVTQANRAPAFGSATYSFSIAEDAATGGSVGSVSATDDDDDSLTYTIESGNGDGKFAIDGATGAITTAAALDHETTSSYTLTVQADDNNGGTDNATVNVTVTDVDESTTGPLAGFTLVDASDQAVLATLTDGASVELADADGGSYGIRADLEAGESAGSVRLELTGAKAVSRTESAAPYSLYGDGGANALRGGSLSAGSYTLTATAYSESGRAGDQLGTLEVSFTVTQANRAPAFGSATYSFSIAEDAATNAAVGTVAATDEDDDTLTYTIESGNGDGVFAIDGGTGAITTAAALDHETTPSYTLTVQADDGNGGTATVTVSVTATQAPDPLSAMKRGTTTDGVPFVKFLEWVPASPPSEIDISAPQLASSPITVNPPGRYLLPQGLWSDNTTLWVSARGASLEADEKLYAYVLSTGARDFDKDIHLAVPDLPDPPNIFGQRDGATGLWMTADTIWASAALIDDVLAYHRTADTTAVPPIAVGDRKPGADFDALPAGATTPVGLWSDGTDMYIADFAKGRIYVHNLSTQAHVKTLRTADGNDNPVGLWSDGTTMWVGDSVDDKVYAYSLSGWTREPMLDIEELAHDNRRPQGMWSDGDNLWVVDMTTDKVFVYDLPKVPTPEKETRLSSLGMRHVNMKYFTPNKTDYVTSSPSRNARTMVTPVTLASGASFVIAPADSQTHLDGHWVEFEDDGETEITVTVTSADSTETLVYTIRILQGDDNLGIIASRGRLRSFSLTGAPDPDVDPDTTTYSVEMPPGTYQTTVTATPHVHGVPVFISPPDADAADGHQIDLVEGINNVRVTVLGSQHRTYTFNITAGEGFTQLSLHEGRACAIRADSSVACWGGDSWAAERYLSTAPGIYTDIRVGDIWTCAIDLDDVATCWSGARTYTVQDVAMIDVRVERICWVKTNGNLGCNIDPGDTPGGKFKSVTIGGNSYTCAINMSDNAVCWGQDFYMEQYKELLDLIRDTNNTYKRLVFDFFRCGLKTDDTVFCHVHSGSSAKWLDVRFPHTSCIVKMNGDAECLMRGKDRDYSHLIIAEPPGPFETVSIGGRHVCGLRTDNTIVCWGADHRNALDVPSIASPWADDPRLLTLELSGVSLNRAFNPEVGAYTASVANAVDEVTVLARATNTGAEIAFNPATDADGTDPGHQVSLSTGENTITVTVTSADGEATMAYTITVTRATP